jgi:hypothetical protein
MNLSDEIEEILYRSNIEGTITDLHMKNRKLTDINIIDSIMVEILLELDLYDFSQNINNYEHIEPYLTIDIIKNNDNCCFFKRRICKSILKQLYKKFETLFHMLYNSDGKHIIHMFDYSYDDIKYMNMSTLLLKTKSGGDTIYHMYDKCKNTIKLVDAKSLLGIRNFTNKNFIEISRGELYFNKIFKYIVINDMELYVSYNTCINNHINNGNKKLYVKYSNDKNLTKLNNNKTKISSNNTKSTDIQIKLIDNKINQNDNDIPDRTTIAQHRPSVYSSNESTNCISAISPSNSTRSITKSTTFTTR